MTRPKAGSTPLPLISFEEVNRVIDGKWMQRGKCLGSHLDMTDLGQGSAEKRAVCDGCPVTDDCLTYSLLTDDRVSIMAGLMPSGRRPFDNGQRWTTCRECGAGFIWVKASPTHSRALCRTCADVPSRHMNGKHQHYDLI